MTTIQGLYMGPPSIEALNVYYGLFFKDYNKLGEENEEERT